MRDIASIRSDIVSLLVAFNMVGRRLYPDDWSGLEAKAIRLGQRAKFPNEMRHRGLDALRSMRILFENGSIGLIYTDEQRRRVPYFQSTGHWITAIHPDAVGTGDGMIELDDRYLYPCVVDISRIIKWRLPTKTVRTGPKRGFRPFDALLDEYFENNPTSKSNAEVIHELGQANANLNWPRKTVMHERINEARGRAKERIRSGLTPNRTPDG